MEITGLKLPELQSTPTSSTTSGQQSENPFDALLTQLLGTPQAGQTAGTQAQTIGQTSDAVPQAQTADPSGNASTDPLMSILAALFAQNVPVSQPQSATVQDTSAKTATIAQAVTGQAATPPLDAQVTSKQVPTVPVQQSAQPQDANQSAIPVQAPQAEQTQAAPSNTQSTNTPVQMPNTAQAASQTTSTEQPKQTGTAQASPMVSMMQAQTDQPTLTDRTSFSQTMQASQTAQESTGIPQAAQTSTPAETLQAVRATTPTVVQTQVNMAQPASKSIGYAATVQTTGAAQIPPEQTFGQTMPIAQVQADITQPAGQATPAVQAQTTIAAQAAIPEQTTTTRSATAQPQSDPNVTQLYAKMSPLAAKVQATQPAQTTAAAVPIPATVSAQVQTQTAQVSTGTAQTSMRAIRPTQPDKQTVSDVSTPQAQPAALAQPTVTQTDTKVPESAQTSGSQQVADSLKDAVASGKTEYSLKLKPDGLGEVNVHISYNAGQIELRINGKESTGSLLMGQITELKTALVNQQIDVSNIYINGQSSNTASFMNFGQSGSNTYAQQNSNSSFWASTAYRTEQPFPQEQAVRYNGLLNYTV